MRQRHRPLGHSVLLVVLVVFAVFGAEPAEPGGPRLKETMTAAEFERCGLQKLSAAELTSLEQWLANHFEPAAVGTAPPTQIIDSAPKPRARGSAAVAVFNRSSGKYHCPTCQWALRCTRNCVEMPLSEAKVRGIPCKVCGGSCP